MKMKQTAYVDFNQFVVTGQNRDLLANPIWQRNVEFLASSLKKNPARARNAIKPAKRA